METTKSTFAAKEMRLLRLAVTTACGQGCAYCFVKKRGLRLSFAAANRALELLLRSPGTGKVLMLYGGEPLEAYPLLRRIITAARQKARALRRSLVISVGTNGLLLDREKTEFFRKSGVRLAVSLDGPAEVHDAFRRGADGAGTYGAVAALVPQLLRRLGPGRLCCLCAVTPGSARDLARNLEHIYGLGFENINVEPVLSPGLTWRKADLEAFSKGMREAAALLYRSALRGKFLFLNSVNKELAGRGAGAVCPFVENFELYPPGRAGFSPLLLNAGDPRHAVWDYKGGWRGKYRTCVYEPASEGCRRCWREYSRGSRGFPAAARALGERAVISRALAGRILREAARRKEFAAYAAEAAQRIFE